MGFLNPALFWTFAGISVPIIIHLLNRFRVKRTIWAAMKFLLEAIEENSRKIQIQDLLLLLLRILAFGMIALALVRPTLSGKTAALLKESQRTAVIILDNSYSMGFQGVSRTNFDQAKDKALEILGQLKGGKAALILMSDIADPIIGTPSTDLGLIKQIIKEAEVSDGATDLLPSIQKAYNIIENIKSPVKEVYIVTDCQANSWMRHKEELGEILDKMSDKAAMFVVMAGGGAADINLGVSNFELRDSGININEPALFSVTVTNFGTAEQSRVPISIWLDDEKVNQKIIPSIGPKSTVTIPFLQRIRIPGQHRIWVEVPHDRLPADNKGYLAIEAFKSLNVLVIEGKSSLQRFKGEGDFLKVALSPEDEEAPGRIYLFSTDKVPASRLKGKRLSKYDVAVLANVSRLDPKTTEDLKRYVQTGGSLLVTLGDMSLPEYYNLLAKGPNPFLPVKITGMIGDPSNTENAFHMSEKDLTHPVVSFFGNETLRKFILLPKFHAAHKLERTGKDAKPILPFSEGSIALAEKKYGRGRVMVYASTLGLAWNDMPLTPTFLMIMRRAMEFLAEENPEGRNIKVNTPIVEPLALSDIRAKIIMTDPKGRNKEIQASVRENESAVIEVDKVPLKGFYTFTIAADKIYYSSNVNTEESTTDSLAKSELENTFTGFTFQFINSTEAVKDILKEKNSGAEVWWYAMAACLALMFVESTLASKFGPKE